MVEESDPSGVPTEEMSDEEAIRNELSQIPLGELQAIQQKVGTKKFNVVLKESREQDHAHSGSSRGTRSFKRLNKNRPREMSSKVRVSSFREVVFDDSGGSGAGGRPTRPRASMDPRFDERTGNFNEELFKKSYGFLSEVRKREKEIVRKKLRKAKGSGRKVELQRLLQSMEGKEAEERRKERKKELMREHRRELKKEGKKFYFVRKSVQKKVELAERYKELKHSGKLKKFLSKKRRKITSKDRKRMPLCKKNFFISTTMHYQ